MKHSRLTLFIAIALMLFLVSCGSSTGSSNSGQTPSTSGTSSSSSSAATIKPTAMTVNGKSITVLTNSQGLTLYYRTSDTPSSVCSGGCAGAWPPFISSSVPSASTSLPGTLSLLTDANGSQVTYNGHPLYTYSGDNAAGQTNGEGIGGVWFVAPTDLSATPTSSNSTPAGPNGY